MRVPGCVFQVAALTCLLFAGCRNDVDTIYGRRTGPAGADSVNGTAVLGKMFVRAGHRVTTWRTLSPRLRQADTIVWIPDRFEPPGEKTSAWMDDWLAEKPGRTLIYVDRDYDAGPHYWSKVRPTAPAAQRRLIGPRRAAHQSAFMSKRASLPATVQGAWFDVDGTYNPRVITTLDGPWSEVVSGNVDIRLNGGINMPADSEILLESDGDLLVGRSRPRGQVGSQRIIVANGSFLLNLPLVHHEHRKLAGKLIDSVGAPGKVVFLESGRDEPEILDEDPEAAVPTGMEMFSQWPLNWVLFHLSIMGILFAYSRWPIFGIPRTLPPEDLTDFGKHVAAVGELLQRSGDRQFSSARLQHYEETVLGETAPAPANPSPPHSEPDR